MDIGQPMASTSAVPLEGNSETASTSNDLMAGWFGGAVGILVSNPLEVLKVRLQTSRHSPLQTPTSRVGAGSRTPSSSPLSSLSSSLKPLPTSSHPAVVNATGLVHLWRTEGLRFMVAGAAAPIIGLAFIDSAFFGGYGFAMSRLGQDRQDPNQLSRVFLSGALSGASCALLQTPIEVVKCRAQAESIGGNGKKKGSFKIAQMIAKKDGLKGFYIGGLMTACRDGISSGIFFWGYFVFRRLLRGQEPFSATSPTIEGSSKKEVPPISEILSRDGKINKAEVGRILLAGGLAGTLSAVVPYPFDIIKTRLQTSTIESRALASPSLPLSPPLAAAPLTIRSVISGIHLDGQLSTRHSLPTSFLYSFLSRHVFAPVSKQGLKGFPAHNKKAEIWTVRILGMKGFLRGLRPTLVSSFVGSGVTITTFELALVWLEGGGISRVTGRD